MVYKEIGWVGIVQAPRRQHFVVVVVVLSQFYLFLHVLYMSIVMLLLCTEEKNARGTHDWRTIVYLYHFLSSLI